MRRAQRKACAGRSMRARNTTRSWSAHPPDDVTFEPGTVGESSSATWGAGGNTYRVIGRQVMSSRLSEKVCIITGTGGSIGREAARTFAREGAMVVGCDLTVDAAQATVDMVRAERVVQQRRLAYFNWLEDISDDEWERDRREEVDLVFYLTRAAWPHLKTSHGPKTLRDGGRESGDPCLALNLPAHSTSAIGSSGGLATARCGCPARGYSGRPAIRRRRWPSCAKPSRPV